ncbi:MAG: hypothetical protein H7144_08890 [Burkholderiales bacterium]|nr:hypothetical protein [Phycisphaerae bacterium]
MISAFRHLDRILRGEATSLESIRENRFDIPVVGVSFVLTLLGMVYGACMGLFSLTASGSEENMQILATTLKVPLLFLLTLLVTFPSLYVFNALFGSRLRLGTMLRLMIGSLAVLLAVLSSIGPIVGFFSISSTSYSFMVILNVVVFAAAGFLGLGFLLQTLHRLTIAQALTTIHEPLAEPVVVPPPLPTGAEGEDVAYEARPISAISRPDHRPVSGGVRLIFRVWMLVFGLVGAQMAWVLRPFIGSPDKPFEWFRERGGNFFESVWGQLQRLFGA